MICRSYTKVFVYMINITLEFSMKFGFWISFYVVRRVGISSSSDLKKTQ